ncbi:Oidioi.mRNA.OKI2018_I69.XSR.g15312.t1.cds [Oikopleura dioica]|uniref:Oidioi.mRNA.OKI2018_I69.XSR.g15312.t1.cds n=1 Tax=Oikopleura dioica TaxID=34765 RepID=A0ABN7SJU3_OIKDI|nr:Oidioi.mRNA.OKI2018_I69.XSR.g15312.t1.cds [Oikopleura dioica]
MSRPWDDCRYFIISECLRKNCMYRHHLPAKTAQLCSKWASGTCQKLDCDSMHFVLKQKNEMLCYFENTPSGCINLSCSYKHVKPRPSPKKDAMDEKVAKYLAELEGGKTSSSPPADEKKSPLKSDKASSDSDEEEDLMAMRARILQSQARARANIVKKTVNRESPPRSPEEELRPTFNVATPPKGFLKSGRKIVSTKKGFSDDDQSDISLDELTDEEQEDLRAQLNKNKEPVTIRRVEDQFRNVETKKSEKKSEKTVKHAGRIISIRNENAPELKRESSSEWVERKITIKKPKKEKAKNPLVTRVVTNVFAGNSSEASSCDSDESPRKSTKRRKPNTSWASVKDEKNVRNRLGNKNEEDLSKQILKARLNRFGGEVSKKESVSVNRRLTLSTTGGGIKSRLGGGVAAILTKECQAAAKQASSKPINVKNRLGEQATAPPRSEQKVNGNEKESPKKKTVNPLRRKRSLSSEKEPIVKEKQPKTALKEVNPFEHSYDVPDIDDTIPNKPVLSSNGVRKEDKTAEKKEITPVIPDPDAEEEATKSPPEQLARKPSTSPVKSRRLSSRALDDMDDLDAELLLGVEESDNLDLGGDIDDEDLFA